MTLRNSDVPPAERSGAPGDAEAMNLELGGRDEFPASELGDQPYRPNSPFVPGVAESLSTEIHLTDYLRLIYKRRWTAVTALVLVVGSAAVYTFTSIPIYQARVRLLIESDNPKVVSYQEVLQQNQAANDYYQTQYRILESRALAKQTLQSAGLWNSDEFTKTAKPSLPARAINALTSWVNGLFGQKKVAEPAAADETRAQAPAIDRLLSRLQVTPVRGSRLVDVVYESPDATMSARVANALAKAYIEQNMEFRFSATQDATEWLSKQMAEQRKDLETGELALQKYREQNDAGSLEERQNIVVQRLADLNAAATKARTTRIEKEALYKQLQSIQNDRAALDTFPAIMSNTFIQQIKTELADLQRQQAQLSERLGSRHPDMLKVRSAIQSAETKLQGEIGKVVESIRNEYEAAAAQERSLLSTLEQQKTEALALNRKAIEYGVLQRDTASSRQLFEGLLQRTKETAVSGQLKTSSIRIVDMAETPRRPVRPIPTTNMAIALGVGVLLSVGLCFFFEYFDNRIKLPEELKDYLGLPCLGMVPAMRTPDTSSPLIGNGAPPNFSESFRAIRTNVLFSTVEDTCRTVCVTSAGPGEGKTVTAANLSVAMAQSGQRVLLIDADMRKPRIHEVFEVAQEPGLSNLLVGNAKASECVRKTSERGLWILPAGHHPPNPSELLGSRRFADLLTSLQGHFEWIIVDTPPVLAVTDACVVAHLMSGVVFVVGAEMVGRQAARGAVEQLQSARARFLGGVLNRVQIERHGYYYSRHYQRDYARYYQSSAGL